MSEQPAKRRRLLQPKLLSLAIDSCHTVASSQSKARPSSPARPTQQSRQRPQEHPFDNKSVTQMVETGQIIHSGHAGGAVVVDNDDNDEENVHFMSSHLDPRTVLWSSDPEHLAPSLFPLWSSGDPSQDSPGSCEGGAGVVSMFTVSHPPPAAATRSVRPREISTRLRKAARLLLADNSIQGHNRNEDLNNQNDFEDRKNHQSKHQAAHPEQNHQQQQRQRPQRQQQMNKKKVLVIAGAGMGCDSGLPDYRSPEGFYRDYPPLREAAAAGISFAGLSEPKLFRDHPRLAWGLYAHRAQLYRQAVPHRGFGVLRWLAGASAVPGTDGLEEGGVDMFVMTSNIDSHFAKAGFPGERVFETHGSLHRLQCIDRCPGSGNWPLDPALRMEVDPATFTVPQEQIPLCSVCGAVARPGVSFFADTHADFCPDRYLEQKQRLLAWLSQRQRPLEESASTPPIEDTTAEPASKEPLVILELGCGVSMHSLRWEAEELVRMANDPDPGSEGEEDHANEEQQDQLQGSGSVEIDDGPRVDLNVHSALRLPVQQGGVEEGKDERDQSRNDTGDPDAFSDGEGSDAADNDDASNGLNGPSLSKWGGLAFAPCHLIRVNPAECSVPVTSAEFDRRPVLRSALRGEAQLHVGLPLGAEEFLVRLQAELLRLQKNRNRGVGSAAGEDVGDGGPAERKQSAPRVGRKRKVIRR